jgi:hypothetical protein
LNSRFLRAALVIAATAATAGGLCAGTAAAQPTRTSAASATTAKKTSATAWRVYFHSHVGTADLTYVTATGPRDAFAVGGDRAGLYVLHWTGSAWRQVSVSGGEDCIPTAVQATSADNVWVPCSNISGSPGTLVYDGHSWHKAPSAAAAESVVLGGTDVWGYTPSCPGPPSAPDCTTDVWRWNGGTVTNYSVPGYVMAMTSGGSRVWVLSEPSADSPTSTGKAQAYESTGAGLHQIASPGRRLGIFPQLAASPKGQVWILDGDTGSHARQALSYWNGRKWSTQLIPNRFDFGSWGFVFDDQDGVWLGPYTHWTGRKWVATSPSGPTEAYELMEVAPVPRSASAWAVGFPGSGRWGLIALLGKRP